MHPNSKHAQVVLKGNASSLSVEVVHDLECDWVLRFTIVDEVASFAVFGRLLGAESGPLSEVKNAVAICISSLEIGCCLLHHILHHLRVALHLLQDLFVLCLLSSSSISLPVGELLSNDCLQASLEGFRQLRHLGLFFGHLDQRYVMMKIKLLRSHKHYF